MNRWDRKASSPASLSGLFLVGNMYLIIVDGILPGLGMSSTSDLNLDACKWRITRGHPGSHSRSLRVFGGRGRGLEGVSVPSSWGVLAEEVPRCPFHGDPYAPVCSHQSHARQCH